MDKAIAKKWAKALRSGKYAQGRSRLRSEDNKFCCLGVLCNIHAQEHPKIAAKERFASLYLGASAYLPTRVGRWAGMNTNTGNLKSGMLKFDSGVYSDLADANDSGVTFKQIANWIAANYKDL